MQILLHSILKSGASGITTWHLLQNFYYKAEQLLQSRAVEEANERNGRGQQITTL